MSNIAAAQSSMRSRPSSGRPTRCDTTATGRWRAKSAIPSNDPRATSFATSSSARRSIVARTSTSADGIIGFISTARRRRCSSPSLVSVVRAGASFTFAESATPRPDTSTASARSAARTSAWRPIAHPPCADSHTAGARSRIAR